jgi:hypothetical protein
VVFEQKQGTKSLKAHQRHVTHVARRENAMKKTLVRFLGGVGMVGGAWLGSGSACAQSINITASTIPGPTRQTLPQVIHVRNQGADATGVTVTFTPDKGAKVDSTCQVDHLPGGIRSYTCLIGTLLAGDTIDIPFSISMTKSGNVDISVEATCDQALTFGALLSVMIF